MRRLTREEIGQIKTLRKRGKSISEIMLVMGLPKTTIWHHIQGIKISDSVRRVINSNQRGSKKRYEIAVQSAREDVIRLLSSEYRELSVIVAMLYWAEGSKRELVFTNTDIDMVRLYLHFIRNVLKVRETDIYLLIRISDPLKPGTVVRFWSKQTKTKSSRIKINHDNVHNKTKSPYGICRVNLRKNGYYLKRIQCIIDAVKEKYAPIV